MATQRPNTNARGSFVFEILTSFQAQALHHEAFFLKTPTQVLFIHRVRAPKPHMDMEIECKTAHEWHAEEEAAFAPGGMFNDFVFDAVWEIPKILKIRLDSREMARVPAHVIMTRDFLCDHLRPLKYSSPNDLTQEADACARELSAQRSDLRTRGAYGSWTRCQQEPG
ncbi:hypothetical protein C8R44DRAFT_731671 [Mycena epipterygia]|nr:hypothetical protein C8R44DRAFT_731671 [Mycena epipterygia]